MNERVETCVDCGQPFFTSGRNATHCLECSSAYGSQLCRRMAVKLDQLMRATKDTLDRQVTHLDPQAYERGERVVIPGPFDPPLNYQI